MRWSAVVLLLSGCATGTPPVDLASVQMFLICLLNCPVSVTLADEGDATDAVPIEQPPPPGNTRALNERND